MVLVAIHTNISKHFKTIFGPLNDGPEIFGPLKDGPEFFVSAGNA